MKYDTDNDNNSDKNNTPAITGAFNKTNSENYTFGETPTIISKF